MILPPSAATIYVRSKTADQVIAILEFIGTSIFFAVKRSFKGFGKIEAMKLAERIPFSELLRIGLHEAIALSMKWMGENGIFSKKKYGRIRIDLAVLGCFTVGESAPRKGPQQPITELLNIDFKLLVEIVRECFLWLKEILVDFSSHKLFPSHGFAFLHRWHTKVFGYRMDDFDRIAEMEALAGDRGEFWRRTLHHEEWESFAKNVEKQELWYSGWSEDSKESIRGYLRSPYDWDGGVEFARQCPMISRLSIEEAEFLLHAKTVASVLSHDVLLNAFAPAWVGNTSLIIKHRSQLLEEVNRAIAYCLDIANGSGVGRPIAHAHGWIMGMVAEKLTNTPSVQSESEEPDFSSWKSSVERTEPTAPTQYIAEPLEERGLYRKVGGVA